MDSKYNIASKSNNVQTPFRTSFNTQASSSSSGDNNSIGNSNNNNGKILTLKRKAFGENGSNGSKKFRLDRPITGKSLQEQRRALPVYNVKDQ